MNFFIHNSDTSPPNQPTLNSHVQHPSTLNTIRKKISIGDIQEALNFFDYWLSENVFSNQEKALEAYTLFCGILNALNLHHPSEMQSAQRCRDDLLKRFCCPSGQQKLAIAWAQLCCRETPSDPYHSDYASYIEAMWYYAKALDITQTYRIEVGTDEIHSQASHLFFPFIQYSFKEELDKAKRKADFDKFGSLVQSLDLLRKHRRFEKEGSLMETLFREARNLWSQISDPESKKKIGASFPCLFEEKEIPVSDQLATYSYRDELKNFREYFKTAFQELYEKRFGKESLYANSLVREFQKEMTKRWIDFFNKTFWKMRLPSLALHPATIP